MVLSFLSDRLDALFGRTGELTETLTFYTDRDFTGFREGEVTITYSAEVLRELGLQRTSDLSISLTSSVERLLSLLRLGNLDIVFNSIARLQGAVSVRAVSQELTLSFETATDFVRVRIIEFDMIFDSTIIKANDLSRMLTQSLTFLFERYIPITIITEVPGGAGGYSDGVPYELMPWWIELSDDFKSKLALFMDWLEDQDFYIALEPSLNYFRGSLSNIS